MVSLFLTLSLSLSLSLSFSKLPCFKFHSLCLTCFFFFLSFLLFQRSLEINSSNSVVLTASESFSSRSAPAPSIGAAVADELNRTLADRIAELESNAGLHARSELSALLKPSGDQIILPKVGSIQTALTQALHTNDDSLLENCINLAAHRSQGGVADSIRRTLARLPIHFVLPLLLKLIQKFNSRPARSLQLAEWIKAIFAVHTPFLLAQPELAQILQPFYATIDARLANFKRILKLNGRLELILSHLDRKNSVENEENQETPITKYVEGEIENQPGKGIKRKIQKEIGNGETNRKEKEKKKKSKQNKIEISESDESQEEMEENED